MWQAAASWAHWQRDRMRLLLHELMLKRPMNEWRDRMERMQLSLELANRENARLRFELARVAYPDGAANSWTAAWAGMSSSNGALAELLVRNKALQAHSEQADEASRQARKLTAAQKAFARGESAYDFDDDSDDSVGGYGGSYGGGFLHAALNILRSYRRDAPPPPRAAPAGCECGQFWRLTAGRHVCRYFGHFQCGACANRWTSAYCWQGEKQEYKRCGANNLPHKKEPLDGRAGTGTGRPHDSSRCGMCKRLGRDCSLA